MLSLTSHLVETGGQEEGHSGLLLSSNDAPGLAGDQSCLDGPFPTTRNAQPHRQPQIL